MVRLLIALGLALSLAAAAPRASAPGYHVVHGWPSLPAGRVLGSAAGVAVNSRNEVLVFHRAGRVWSEPLPTDALQAPTIAAFDGTSGRFLREFGGGLFAMPHGLTADAEDNLWVTDVALNQVVKLSPDGKVLLTLGARGVAGNDQRHFNRPTQVAVAEDGTVYVADGYRNTRIVRFSPEGRFLSQWGAPGQGAGQFEVPHAIVIEGDKVYVADRENDRVQIFDLQGRFIAAWKSPAIGRPYGIAAPGNGRFAIADGGEQPQTGPDRSALVIVDATGKILERVGRFGNYDGQFRMAHHVAAGRDRAVYVVDITGQRVQKFVPG